MTNTPTGTYENAAQQQLGRLASELDYADMGEVILENLHDFLNGFQARLSDVGDAVEEMIRSVDWPRHGDHH